MHKCPVVFCKQRRYKVKICPRLNNGDQMGLLWIPPASKVAEKVMGFFALRGVALPGAAQEADSVAKMALEAFTRAWFQVFRLLCIRHVAAVSSINEHAFVNIPTGRF